MIESVAGKAAVSALATHIVRWIANLGRAGDYRKEQSRQCLERVILAVRKTAVYCRSLDQGKPVSHDKEAEIAIEWTQLALELERLKLDKLAKKCRVSGWYWEDQGRFDEEFLRKAQVSFNHIETLASRLLKSIG
ncbi:MAG: hypothetical protein OQK12_13260 [Motiliproteus sp.]|nr:hypothetical protein [Motiliproteus sp.]MCW9054130.1 hypothetical protein [Motiliproteus sp.]